MDFDINKLKEALNAVKGENASDDMKKTLQEQIAAAEKNSNLDDATKELIAQGKKALGQTEEPAAETEEEKKKKAEEEAAKKKAEEEAAAKKKAEEEAKAKAEAEKQAQRESQGKDIDELNKHHLDNVVPLSDVTASTKEGEAAIHQMEKVDMATLISAPMNAAVEANFNASKKMLSCIKEIGLSDDDSTNVVVFTFTKNGQQVKMSVPLLTLVPISALTIKEMTYEFKLKIDTNSSIDFTQTNSSTVGYNPDGKQEGVSGSTASSKETKTKAADDKAAAADAVKKAAKVESTFGVSYSSKKDSTATQKSKYSVETSMDVKLTIGPDSLPAGITKMLEVLNDAIDVYNPNGELSLGAYRVALDNGVAMVTATYFDTKGNLALSKIKCEPDNKDNAAAVKVFTGGNSAIIRFTKAGDYTVSAENLSAPIHVDEAPKKTETKTETKTEPEE